MLSEETIKKTAVCAWSAEDDCFIVRSSLLPITAGIGATASEAWHHFSKMLGDIYPYLKKGKVASYNKAGRPAKGGLALNTLVRPDTRAHVAEFAKELGISQGEFIDFLLLFYESKKDEHPRPLEAPSSFYDVVEELRLVTESLAKTFGRPSKVQKQPAQRSEQKTLGARRSPASPDKSPGANTRKTARRDARTR